MGRLAFGLRAGALDTLTILCFFLWVMSVRGLHLAACSVSSALCVLAAGEEMGNTGTFSARNCLWISPCWRILYSKSDTCACSHVHLDTIIARSLTHRQQLLSRLKWSGWISICVQSTVDEKLNVKIRVMWVHISTQWSCPCGQTWHTKFMRQHYLRSRGFYAWGFRILSGYLRGNLIIYDLSVNCTQVSNVQISARAMETEQKFMLSQGQQECLLSWNSVWPQG